MTNIRTENLAHVAAQASATVSFGRFAALFSGLFFGLLAGCGGGASTAGNTTTLATAEGLPVVVVSSTDEPAPEFVTLPQYKALRAGVVSVTGGVVPSASELAALRAANYKTAVEQLLPGLQPGNNALVVPPLTDAVVRMLAAASSGDTLAQIKSKYDVAPTPYVAALQTSSVASQFWADKDRLFRTGFLAATDSLGPFARLSDWGGSETGFASGGFAADPALATSFSALLPWLTPAYLPAPAQNIRLVASHQVTANAPWAAVQPFDGVFDRGQTAHDLVRMPMVRVSAGVRRFAGNDFTADFLPMAGGRQLLTLRPNAGDLATFAVTRLPNALAEAMGALGAGAALAAGAMVLPQQALTVSFDAQAPLASNSIKLPFDDVNANLRNLDAPGGSFARRVLSSATLQVSVEGFDLTATDVTAFTFSPKNINVNNSGASSYWLVSAYDATIYDGLRLISVGSAYFNLFTCNWPTPNLRSFYLAVVDGNRWVVSLAAVQQPVGTAVTPDKTAYNPWPNDPRWTINDAGVGNIPASTNSGSVPLQVVLPGDPPAPTYWDVVSEAAQYGFVLNGGVYTHASCVDK